MTPELQAALNRYLKRPIQRHYLALRSLAMAAPAYDPWSRMLAEVIAALKNRDLEGAQVTLNAQMEGWLLTPSAHRYCALVAQHRRDPRAAGAERRLAQAMLKGLVETGRGTPRHPFLVSRVTDEYDLIKHHDLQAQERRTIMGDARCFDVLICANNVSIWFDITDMMARVSALRDAQEAAAARAASSAPSHPDSASSASSASSATSNADSASNSSSAPGPLNSATNTTHSTTSTNNNTPHTPPGSRPPPPSSTPPRPQGAPERGPDPGEEGSLSS